MFDVTTNVSLIFVLLEGIISFFSPCILPILPLYFSYLGGNAKTIKENGEIEYQRGKVLLYTFFFVLGISCAFFLLGLSFFAFGKFFEEQKFLWIRVGGILIIFMGMVQMGLFKIPLFQREWRVSAKFNHQNMNLLMAFVMGFTFSFAWTPCVGPALSSVLIMASSADSNLLSMLYITVYAIGFILPFLAIAMFTGAVLNMIKKYEQSLQFLIKVGGVLLVVIGFMMFAGAFHKSEPSVSSQNPVNSEEKNDAVDFTIYDLNGQEVKLSDYRGKTIYLSFWATWCPYCKKELPDLQEVYEDYGENKQDVVILSIVMPGGREMDIEGITSFVQEKEVTFPVLTDIDGSVFANYVAYSLPMTYLINSDFKIEGYLKGGIDKETMVSIIEQTLEP